VSQEAKARKIYERRILTDAMSRLAKTLDLDGLPLSEVEVQTLQKRTRAAIFGSPRRKEQLARYKAHLATMYSSTVVEHLARHLEEINNQIAWEEK
jgi:hypothetical protein